MNEEQQQPIRVVDLSQATLIEDGLLQQILNLQEEIERENGWIADHKKRIKLLEEMREGLVTRARHYGVLEEDHLLLQEVREQGNRRVNVAALRQIYPREYLKLLRIPITLETAQQYGVPFLEADLPTAITLTAARELLGTQALEKVTERIEKDPIWTVVRKGGSA